MPEVTHEKSNSKTLLLALLVGLAMRLLFVGQVPGIHFDEAWAANYAARIVNEAGFWPIDAMSPYTHPWSHYITALFFKIFGIHLWVARLAGISMSGAGIVLLARALSILGEKRALTYFACLCAICVPSILNERFAIEINTFHVFCLGLFVYGLVKKRWWAIGLSVIFGVTSHILFLAPVLAAFWIWATYDELKSKHDRVFIGLTAFLLLPFFASVYTGIPEKGKALTLIAADLGVLFYVIYPFSLIAAERKLRWILLPVAGVFLLILSAMMEGDLSVAFTHGRISSPLTTFLCIAMTTLGAFYLLPQAWRQIRQKNWPKYLARWVFYLVFFVGVMSTKPAPRYFEMIFLVALVAIAVVLSRLPSEKTARFFVSVFVLISAVQWRENYILPGLHHEGVDRSFRYLIFHDNSSDSLSKQNLVAELGSEGCSPLQVTTSDPRLGEALKFLERGDWPIESGKKCPSQQIKVERAATGGSGQRFEEFVLSGD